jgi:predicted DNA-binding protein (MmcQ/YjbR family)
MQLYIAVEPTGNIMEIEDIQKICKKFKGVTEDIKWEDHLCFNVGGKMFLITAPDKVPQSATFKVSDEDFETLPERDGFIPAPYMARYKWIYVDDIHRMNKDEWTKYLKQSYDLVFQKLPLKTKKLIGGLK